MASDSLTFFAVNRCVYANSGSVIILFGLSPHNKKYTVLESELHRNNVHLGDFLNACLINETTLKLFQKCSHPNDENVSVVQNEAYLRFPSAEATFDNNGSLIFNTRNFGPIVSSDQNLSPGRYYIVIKATGQLEKGDITLCADVIDEANFYEEPRSKLSRKGISRYPTIKSHRSNSPSDGAYEYIDVIYPGDQEYEHLEHFNTIPSNNLYGMRAADQLIENKNVTLPKLHPPAPLPRRLKPALSNPTETPTRTISTDSRDGYTIEQLIEKLPTLELEGIENSVPVPQKPSAQNLMKAFVHSVLQHPNQVKMHFIWICGLNKNAVLKLPMHDLELGHFFEGIFEEKPNGSWECTRHLREIEPLLNGIIVQNGKKEKVELISTITQYQPASISLKYAQGYVNHLGVVYDKNSRLNPDSNGRNVRIQKLKLDGIFEWVVTGFE
ncbi:Cadherin domain-containing protein [Caenorhabditis elegans]|uniref:Cadherin domain-containing protein n=1 Tax=Caenorhabditis elegans TaxID=6239 RepID=O44152_CAEEL|nr:Cadherin domain-containing protein [Caenorhabditis elegans]CCD67623.1 Cadherin domain-containing protein [Caenorhabditis elegans]|eukprot:NP_500935.2 Uncharacterized protein CELE_C49A9.4 [Caenorhabditis elegans]